MTNKNQTHKDDIRSIQQCFRVLYLDNNPSDIYIPACVQFKIKDFTQVNFQNLSAQVNGVLCVSFLIFTHDKHLQDMLLERLYWNPQQKTKINQNRRKMTQRSGNYIPIMLNKDINIKVPTTRQKQFQVQCFKTKIFYKKKGKPVQGWRVYHVIRKQFKIQILKSNYLHSFIAPYNLINLDFTVTLDHMDIQLFDYKLPANIEHQANYVKELNQKLFGKQKYNKFLKQKLDQLDQQYLQSMKGRLQQGKSKFIDKQNIQLQPQPVEPVEELMIKRIHFNTLRIEQPLEMKNLSIQQRLSLLSPMISSYTRSSFGKYDIAEAKLQAFTYDQREILNIEDNEDYSIVLQDKLPIQRKFQPFKYSIFKIPLYRFPVVDIMTIFAPLYLLAFISIFVYYQNAQIMNRILNISALMIAYAAIQPIIREILPDVSGLTLVDLLIYMSLSVNILFLTRSISIRDLIDQPQADTDPDKTNYNYQRQKDILFIISIILTLINVITVISFIIGYSIRKKSYKCDIEPKIQFQISTNQNWTIKLLMNRSFARYLEQLNKIDEVGDKGAISQSKKTYANHPFNKK